jgi:hypothetical protein
MMSNDVVLRLIAQERKATMEMMDRRIKSVEDRAAADLDAIRQQTVGQNAAGEAVAAFGTSTPGPSSAAKRVVFATTPQTPIVRVDLDQDVDEDDDDDAAPNQEVSLQEHAQQAVRAVYAGAGVGASAAATKRDKQPPPLSFWTGRAPEPPGMGQIGGRVSSFIGKLNAIILDYCV